MTAHPSIPNLAERQQAIAQLRESNRQLELVSLTLDEIIAMVESDLRHQRRDRLQKRLNESSK
jgi:hypothetical protein